MTDPAFEPLRRHPIPALRLEFQEYRHRVTGARHLHLTAEDPHNAFLVAFLTVPQDSTGVAHILNTPRRAAASVTRCAIRSS